ncbi:hypothetical protein GQ43DRAFT_443371 [Delitschia confertaspora ATCC 74209]|uniref:Uncharacterized protein n=1 Tax=Delitschia confertaspora ATCC 74209 TaxID=1513339 RepID=A0A9P4JFF3_9PLEO|nr:hypothetical protein GQ43DRAFT_443371 [Delitschia confertaspora ATCC 74209]
MTSPQVSRMRFISDTSLSAHLSRRPCGSGEMYAQPPASIDISEGAGHKVSVGMAIYMVSIEFTLLIIRISAIDRVHLLRDVGLRSIE